MNYTIKKLATLSGATVRTLRFYDEIGILKPAYVAENGYRYYQDPQLLQLQQILFFRELGFELKQIQEILGQSDFNKLETLRSHKKVLRKNITRMTKLIKTVDKTINHLKGTSTMHEDEIFYGFDRKQQKKYEEDLMTRYGDSIKSTIDESNEKMKNWSEQDWQASVKEFDAICKELTNLLIKKFRTDDPKVQAVIQKHSDWLKRFWTPNKESYVGLGQGYTELEWKQRFEAYHSKLAEYLAEAMSIFAKRKLS